MDVYKRLGIRRVINACGHVTMLGGSLMRPEVLEAMNQAACWFVDVEELLVKAGDRIANLAGVEAACITSGAAAGLLVATAACLTGTDSQKIRSLPDTVGMKNEVIIHRCHRNVFDQAIRQAGACLVEVGVAWHTEEWEIEAAIGDKTAAIAYFVWEDERLSVPLRDVIGIAQHHGIPVIVDAAAELPPADNLHKFNDMGADLVIFSGGKGLGGPQSSGMILGRRDLIDACRLNCNPRESIGRPLKVGKEEIIGLVTALELFLEMDFTTEQHRWEEQVSKMEEILSGLKDVTLSRSFPFAAAVRPSCVPRLYILIDEQALGITPSKLVKMLRQRDPIIAVEQVRCGIGLIPAALKEGEEEIAAHAVREILSRKHLS